MKIKVTLSLTILIFLLTGCNDYNHVRLEGENTIYYTKDLRTEICFANKDSITKDGYIVTSIAVVACDKINLPLK